jgi:molecular chaperone DnaK
MGCIVGIDLGTTFSAVATLDEFGQPSIVHNAEGENVTASVMEFFSDGRVDVGDEARRNLGIRGLYAVGRFKKYMGGTVESPAEGSKRTWSTYQALKAIREDLGKDLTPTDLSALVLKKLKQDAEEALHDEIVQAVVTVPASFSNEARKATMAAAKQVGLNIEHIINEPTAAALSYSFANTGAKGIYAVYDLGGGTFDISIIRVNGTDIEVLSSNGVLNLGGDDFDRALQTLAMQKYTDEFGGTPDPRAYTLNNAEQTKITLSRQNRDRASASFRGKEVDIRREEFEECISSYIAQAEMLCQASLDDAEMQPKDIDCVVLAGGSTRIPKVRESVKKIFGRDPVPSKNPDEVVALGASLYAAVRGDQSVLTTLQRDAIDEIDIQERTTKCFGTLHLGVDELLGDMTEKNGVLIERDTAIPCQVTKTFYTVADNQVAVDVSVTESARHQEDPNFVKVIWSGELELPGGRPRGQPIEITYGFDDSQIMHCSFKDTNSGQTREQDLTPGTEDSSGDGIDIDEFLLE